MESIKLTSVTSVSFVNAVRRLILERHLGAMYTQDEFVYNENMKSFDVGFSYRAPEFYKTDFNPYRLPEDPPTLVWEIRPPPLGEDIRVQTVTGENSIRFSDGKWHFAFSPKSEIATLQPSEYYTDLNYILTVNSAAENARYGQLNCFYSYKGSDVSDDAPIPITFTIESRNDALNFKEYCRDMLADIYDYLNTLRAMFDDGESQIVRPVIVDDSAEVSVIGFNYTLVNILLSQTPKLIDPNTLSFRAYPEHPVNDTVIIKIEPVGDKKIKHKSWDRLLVEMIDKFILEYKTVFKAYLKKPTKK